MSAVGLILTLAYLLLLAAVYLGIRNMLVFQFRMKVLNRVFAPGNDRWEEDLITMESVSYDRMLYSLRPLSRFYQGTRLEAR
jgi:hypothetical protein